MSRSFKHLTPRYIVNRLRVIYDERKNPGNPWLTADAVRLLGQLLKPSDIGVEYGSGRSTIWFARRLGYLVSIEQDKHWYEKVKPRIVEAGLDGKVDYRRCEDESEYARQAQSFADESVDFCLVDGVARDKCAVFMLPKLRSGGILVIDNVNWYLPNDWSHSPNTRRGGDGCASDAWREVSDQLSTWRRVWTTNGVTDTGIWLKP